MAGSTLDSSLAMSGSMASTKSSLSGLLRSARLSRVESLEMNISKC